MLLRSKSAHIHRTPEAIANLLAGRHPQDLMENRYNTFPGFNFKFRDLKNNFQQTNLSNAKLIGANLANANLQLLPGDLDDHTDDDETVFGNNPIDETNGY
ncbi:pentapeptide repeat-containing protein [Nostoc sp.]|uniref:pentapeptide repeat-containing protein n=1 Tax=Nostoc sp. TaxID=1180 RepID=UPI002FF4FA19